MVRSYRLSCRLRCRALRLAPALLALVSALHVAHAAGAELDGAALPAAPPIVQRADPSQDVQVATLLNQQAAAVRSTAATQILNMQGRLHALHGDDAACDRALGHAKAIDAAPAPVRGADLGPPSATPIEVPLTLCRRGDVAAAWSAGSLQVGDTEPRAGAGGFGFRSNGVTLGTDARLGSSLTLGIGVGLAHERAGVAPDATSNSADSVGATAYASYRPSKHMFVDAMVGYGDLKMNSARRYGERGRIAAERRASEWFASLAAACQLKMAGTDFAPYTRVDVLRAALRGYTEVDGSA
ncbi:MAG: autotransporter outer membrane beta-barrel domain-containing protein, partial [Caldimonas sp.]